jgi:hypothetical protein
MSSVSSSRWGQEVWEGRWDRFHVGRRMGERELEEGPFYQHALFEGEG